LVAEVASAAVMEAAAAVVADIDPIAPRP